MDGCDLQITLGEMCLARWCSGRELIIPSVGLWKATGTGVGLKLGSMQAQDWPTPEFKMLGPAIYYFVLLPFSLPSRHRDADLCENPDGQDHHTRG